MKISHLLILMNTTDLSPEQMAKRLGISNMTIRRWMKKSSSESLPAIYEKTIWDAIYQMVAEGMLAPSSTVVQKAVKENQKLYFRAAMKSLGIEKVVGGSLREFSMESIEKNLLKIGAKTEHQIAVEKQRKKILSFRRLGREWNRRITTLIKVVTAKKISNGDKLVAYGALFYLLCPLDLIPDSFPVFGLMDDFFVLGLAATYYIKKYKFLFG